jgi:dCMP deaminase
MRKQRDFLVICPFLCGGSMAKRENYISWDQYFMGVALLSAQRSKDPNTQVGACIVNSEHRIVGVGYNGFPAGCGDDALPWDREGEYLDTKYPFVVHAELNAILNSIQNLRGCTIYVALFPCNECAKAIIQSGISEIVYLSDKYADTDAVKASKLMLAQANVKMRKLDPLPENIVLKFS